MKQKINLIKIINFRPIFYSFLAFLFGIIVSRELFAGNGLYIALVSVSFALLILGCGLYKKWVPIIVIVVSFFIGTGCYFLSYNTFLGKTYEGKQEVVARVSDVISESDGYYNIVLDDCHVSGENAKNIYLTIKKSGEMEIKNGDIVSFNSYVDHVHLFELKHFQTFYLRNRTAYKSEVSASEVSVIDGNIKLDEKIRHSIKDVLFKNMSDDSAGIAFAMLTGDKTNISDERLNSYSGAGIVHILTVSGLHITFLIAVLSFILKKMKINKFVNFALIAAFLIFYCYICNFTPSVLRASIMGLVLISASLFAREYDKFTALAIAGFLILFINPLSAFDVGFLMSFSSVMVIFLLQRKMEKLFSKFLPKPVASGLALTISAQLGIIPYLAIFGQEFNILSFVINLFLIPIFEVLFILLFASLIIGFIPYIGAVLKLSDWGIYGISYVANFFAGTSARISLKEHDILFVALSGMIVFVLSGLFMVNKKIKALVASILFCVLSSYTLANNLSPYHYTTSAYTLTSYGDQSVFLVSKEGEVAFIGDKISSLDRKFLKSSGILKVDYSFATDVYSTNIDTFIGDSKDIGAKQVVLCEVDASGEDKIIASKNESNFAGTFMFNYVYDGSKFIGIKVDFDNCSIFFASKGNLSYNNLEYLQEFASNNTFDGVFLGNKYYVAQSFSRSKQVFGQYDNEFLSYSHLKYGNLKLDLKNNKVGSLD